MYYKHELDYTYPDNCDAHMIEVNRVKEVVIDESYPYLDRSRRFKIMRIIYRILINSIVFPLCRITHGLKIYGKENLKKHKDAFSGGAITISNHVFYWDYICVLKAIRPHISYFPAWKNNFEGPSRNFIRLSGGIPIPTDSVRAMVKFNRAIEEVLESGEWLHFYPEGSMWFFYPDIRPLKKAVFGYAVKFNKPIIPITMSFRPRKGIIRLFSKKPCVDLHIGEPLFPNTELSRREAENELMKKAYHIMQVMNGINPGDPTYNTDMDPEHYKKTM